MLFDPVFYLRVSPVFLSDDEIEPVFSSYDCVARSKPLTYLGLFKVNFWYNLHAINLIIRYIYAFDFFLRVLKPVFILTAQVLLFWVEVGHQTLQEPRFAVRSLVVHRLDSIEHLLGS